MQQRCSNTAANFCAVWERTVNVDHKIPYMNEYIYSRTVSSLSDDVAENEIYRTPEQHKDDTVASSSRFTDIFPRTPTVIHVSPPMLTPTRVRTLTPTPVTSRTSTPNNVPLRTPSIPATNSRSS